MIICVRSLLNQVFNMYKSRVKLIYIMIYDDVCIFIELDKFICIRYFIGRFVRNIIVFIE